MLKELKGAGTALVTPFKSNFDVDYDAFRKLVRRQIDNGIHYLVPLGTTGETPCLESDEKKKLIEITLDETKGEVPVIVGVGSNSTKQVLQNINEYKNYDIDGYLIVTPYYNKPTQQGMYEHFKVASEATDKAIVLYNVPARTSINMTSETTLKLCELENIIGIKEASSNMTQISEILKYARESFNVISGNDDETLEICTLGGVGVISVASNLAPKQVSQFVNLILDKNFEEANKQHHKLLNLLKNCFVESNPIPVKAGLNLLGHIENVLRLPLTISTDATNDIMKQTIIDSGINY
ncbi:MAG TPA: 4-hydroxy-tetrahydrodipicolinate synthase [Ignavibacteria bacterium]|nr:4-hydroxy-tetrahydrodipicolinate synthase [Ignavibacteria bacterium]